MRAATVKQFKEWLSEAAPKGRSMREYVEKFGGLSPREMIARASDEKFEVEVKFTGNKHRARMYARESGRS